MQNAPKEPPPLDSEAVVAHTAGMWKYVPVSADEPEPAPEYLNTFEECCGGRVIAARVRGKKHKHEGTNCDDWYETAYPGNITIAAVSDGAGSKVLSRIGARESCRAAVNSIKAQLDSLMRVYPRLTADLCGELTGKDFTEACGRIAEVLQNAVNSAFLSVESAFRQRCADEKYTRLMGRPPVLSDFAATLLAAAVIPLENGERLFVTCQIGDGMIALIDTEGDMSECIKPMSIPDGGDFSGETEFLTSEKMRSRDALRARTKISRNKSDLLLLMTDGVCDDYFPDKRELIRLYFDLIANGILPSGKTSAGITPEQLRFYKALPPPASYPWVNDPAVRLPLRYTKKICETANVSYEELWNNRPALELGAIELEEMSAADDRSMRLRMWLDNYVERGSFDDRTLVIVQMKNKG